MVSVSISIHVSCQPIIFVLASALCKGKVNVKNLKSYDDWAFYLALKSCQQLVSRKQASDQQEDICYLDIHHITDLDNSSIFISGGTVISLVTHDFSSDTIFRSKLNSNMFVLSKGLKFSKTRIQVILFFWERMIHICVLKEETSSRDTYMLLLTISIQKHLYHENIRHAIKTCNRTWCFIIFPQFFSMIRFKAYYASMLSNVKKSWI